MDVERLRKKQGDRYAVLRAAYDLTDGRRFCAVAPEEVSERTGLPVAEFLEVASYLEDEGLLEPAASDGSVFLTHAGIVEVEASITRPDRPTEHFPLLVFQQTFNAPVGAVQTGAGATAAVHQEAGAAAAEVVSLLREIGALLPDRPEAHEAVAALEEEARSPAPRRARLQAFLAAVWAFTKDAVTVAPKVLEVAERLGLKLPGS